MVWNEKELWIMGEKGFLLAKKVVYGTALLFLLFLFPASLIYFSDGYELFANFRMFAVTVLGGSLALFLLAAIVRCLEKLPSRFLKAGGVLLLLIEVGFAAWWILNSANLPQSDPKSIYDIACRARDHDLLPFAPTGSYMSLWPFQSGLVLFMEVILRLIPHADEMTIQWVYPLFLVLLLISGYGIVHRMFANRRISMFWCLLMAFFLPDIFFVNNMYGDLPSLALTFFSLWMVTEYIHVKFWPKLVLAGLGMAAAVAIKKNSIIFLIAFVLVLLTMLLFQHKKVLAVLAVLLAATVTGSVLPRSFYEHRAKNTMGDGMPAIAYIAMGLQWSEGRSAGAWNGYHSDLFLAQDYNAEATSRISLESVKGSLRYMLSHPAYGVKFFANKWISQWDREDYSSLYMTLDFYADRTPAAWSIYKGEAKELVMLVMILQQSIVYFGALCYCISRGVRYKKRGSTGEIWNLTLMVAFIGGFLFSGIWEAGSRYVYPYVVALVPYSAAGLADLLERIDLWAEAQKRKREG